jgi:hypothetical protein
MCAGFLILWLDQSLLLHMWNCHSLSPSWMLICRLVILNCWQDSGFSRSPSKILMNQKRFQWPTNITGRFTSIGWSTQMPQPLMWVARKNQQATSPWRHGLVFPLLFLSFHIDSWSQLLYEGFTACFCNASFPFEKQPWSVCMVVAGFWYCSCARL